MNDFDFNSNQNNQENTQNNHSSGEYAHIPVIIDTPASKFKNAVLQIARGLGYFVLFNLITNLITIGSVFFFYLLAAFQNPDASQEVIDLTANSAINQYSYLISSTSYLIALGVVVLIHIKNNDSLLSMFSFNRKLPIYKYVLAFLGGILAYYAVNAIFWILPQSWMEEYAQLFSSEGMSLNVYYIIAVVILAPIVEEIIFRQLMVTRFARVMPKFVAAILVAVIFGIAHMQKVQSIYAALLGVLMGIIFVCTDSIIVPILFHFSFNMMSITSFVIDTTNWTQEQFAAYNLYSFLAVVVSIPLLVICIYFIFRKSFKEQLDQYYHQNKDSETP